MIVFYCLFWILLTCKSAQGKLMTEEDYEKVTIVWSSPDDYEIDYKLGAGKYGTTYLGTKKSTGQRVAIKCLVPITMRKVKREIVLLHTIQGGPNVLNLIDLIEDPESGGQSIVVEMVDHEEHDIQYPRFTPDDVRYYMYQLLKGLAYIHSCGVFHRDVKPQNTMYDAEKRKLVVVDMGLGEHYYPDQDYNVKVASRYFKGPELLLHNRWYDYALDVWSAGTMLASLIFKKEPFFKGKDNADMIKKHAEVLGTDALNAYLKRHNLKLRDDEQEVVPVNCPKKDWTEFVNANNKQFAVPEALDLLSKMLVLEGEERISARDALEHPWFKTLREGDHEVDGIKGPKRDFSDAHDVLEVRPGSPPHPPAPA